MKKGLFFHSILLALLLLAGCGPDTASQDVPATLTLAPNVSRTPRFTATPIPSRTALPSATFTASVTTVPPTPSDTPTPTMTPPILGSVNSLQSINVREGPGVSFAAIVALRPATRLEILGRNNDGQWLNVRMEDGAEGWVLANLIRFQPTEPPPPTMTPSPDLTQQANTTGQPTALFGGGTITPTPPRSISGAASPTAIQENANPATVEGLQLPNLEAINETATALAGGGGLATVAVTSGTPLGGPTGGPLPQATGTVAPAGASGIAATGSGVDVLAYCDNRAMGAPPPSNLASGSTIDVFWNWFAATRQQVQDHLDASTYTITLDGETLDYRRYQGSIRQENGQYVVYWFVPTEPLDAGQHTISYRVTWSSQISDGFESFGPGTAKPEETGTCTFTVR